MGRKKKKSKKNNHRIKVYFSYQFRLILYISFLIVFISLSFLMLKQSFTYKTNKDFKYSENSNIKYQVYLKDNDYYEKNYLEENMVYIANLIKDIKITYDYYFDIEKPINCDFNYKIIANLLIANESKDKLYFQKKYVLVEDKMRSMINENHIEISETIEIDYDIYNKIANSFKNEYAINSLSSLVIELVVEKNNSSIKEVKSGIINKSSLTIPLSEKAININIDSKEIDNSNTIMSDTKKLTIYNKRYLSFAIVCVTICIILLIEFIIFLYKTKNKKSIYDKYINKLLKEYDRVIAYTKTFPDTSNYQVIKVDRFIELLDIRDNLQLPIMYYIVSPHIKAFFYIIHNNEMYLFVVKRVDLEKDEEYEKDYL